MKSIDFRGFLGPNGYEAPLLEKFLNSTLSPLPYYSYGVNELINLFLFKKSCLRRGHVGKLKSPAFNVLGEADDTVKQVLLKEQLCRIMDKLIIMVLCTVIFEAWNC